MEREFLEPVFIDAFDLDDAWFQCLSAILEKGHVYTITRGSYEGQKRLEFDFVVIRVKKPSHQIIPIIPEGMSIPAPTDMDYIQGYLSYLLSGVKTQTEDYTYGERLVGRLQNCQAKTGQKTNEKNMVQDMPLNVNQVEEVIKLYKNKGFGTNQATMEIGMPSDIKLNDPPCLRIIDTRIRYGKLHFILYFRSWDLWGGFPSNLGGLQLVKQYMASEIGVEDGEIVAVSKGLHLYNYSWDLAKIRTNKNNLEIK